MNSAEFPHSEIPGSMDVCSSPRLIAAYHVFHRLPVPRHSPCALCSLTVVYRAPRPPCGPRVSRYTYLSSDSPFANEILPLGEIIDLFKNQEFY